jgi:hypothetical protein
MAVRGLHITHIMQIHVLAIQYRSQFHSKLYGLSEKGFGAYHFCKIITLYNGVYYCENRRRQNGLTTSFNSNYMCSLKQYPTHRHFLLTPVVRSAVVIVAAAGDRPVITPLYNILTQK